MISTHECMNTMKRFFISAVLSGLVLVTFAQGEYDVYRYSQVDLLGTSRYMSMAGAFGALGGDMSAVSQNPGGIGVYRSSEISFTPFMGYSTVSTDFNSTGRKESKLVGGVNSVGCIGSFRPSNSETINNINIGLSYTRTKDFGKNTHTSGKDRPYSLLDKICTDYSRVLPIKLNDLGLLAYKSNLTYYESGNYESVLNPNELVDNSFYMNESGSAGVVDITLGANWGHFMYMGIGLGVNTIDYRMMSSYKEASQGTTLDPATFEYELRNALSTTGAGVSLKIGAILRPFPFLRFGFALHSPTYYALNDAFGSSITTDLTVDGIFGTSAQIAESNMDYQVQAPGKIMYSAAYLFGQRAMISFDCDVVDYRDMSARSASGMPSETTNDAIDNHFKTAYNIRLGGEYRFGDNVSVRAGFASNDQAYLENMSSDEFVRTVGTTPHYAIDKPTMYITGGLGYRSGAFTLDAAVTDRLSGESFYPFYDNSPEVAGVNKYADVKLNRLNLAVTAGVRF